MTGDDIDYVVRRSRERQDETRELQRSVMRLMAVPLAVLLVGCVVGFAIGNQVLGLTLLLCVPMPAGAFVVVHLILRRERRELARAILNVEGLRRRTGA